jgi:FAD binding domain
MRSNGLAAFLAQQPLDGEVIGPAHPGYARRRVVWNAMIDRRPGAIVRARSVEDVRGVVRVAAERGERLAARGGGPSIPGLSTCDDGIVLDLSQLRRIDADAAARTVTVEAGALLADIDAAGAQFGLVTPAGVVSHTGVAGLTLGGGMGWLSRRFGMNVDSLLGAELITADGRLVRISLEEEPDLFWAIRGGGGNFGVVTSFRFSMHDVATVVVGSWRHPIAQAAPVLAACGELARNGVRELTLCLTLLRDALSVTACWSGDLADADRTLGPYDRLGRPSERSLTSTRFVDLQRRHDETFAWGRRYYVKGGYFRELDQRAVEALLAAAASIPNSDTEIYILQLGGAVADVAEEDTAFTGRTANFFWISEAVWDDRADEANCVAWGRAAAATLAAHSMTGNYVNEQSDLGREGVLSAYGDRSTSGWPGSRRAMIQPTSSA